MLAPGTTGRCKGRGCTVRPTPHPHPHTHTHTHLSPPLTQVRVEALVGQGGYSDIYRVVDGSGRLYALKHLRLAGDAEHIAEVQREAKTMARVRGAGGGGMWRTRGRARAGDFNGMRAVGVAVVGEGRRERPLLECGVAAVLRVAADRSADEPAIPGPSLSPTRATRPLPHTPSCAATPTSCACTRPRLRAPRAPRPTAFCWWTTAQTRCWPQCSAHTLRSTSARWSPCSAPPPRASRTCTARARRSRTGAAQKVHASRPRAALPAGVGLGSAATQLAWPVLACQSGKRPALSQAHRAPGVSFLPPPLPGTSRRRMC